MLKCAQLWFLLLRRK